jgi:transposase
MLTADQINAIHRLHWAEHWSVRKIARHLHIGRRTLAKYLETPAPTPAPRQRASKLDPFKSTIAEWLAQDPTASAVVIAQRLRPLGFDGGLSILKEHLHAVRGQLVAKRAYVRMEPAAGERFEIDWGHFGALLYQGHARKLYAFCLIECHSRKLYVEFTHSQSFETFVRCHIHAFQAMGGVARELWYDNLATAVAEHDGNLVRFQPRFLGFAREYNFLPRACHVRAAWEKGKVERSVGYVRQNFWPLRSFTDLADVNLQVRRWLDEVANRRRHRETSQTPEERFRPEALHLLPAITPDYRDTAEAAVYKDLRLSFRWQSLLCAAALCRASTHGQGRRQLGDPLRPASGSHLLRTLLATRPSARPGAFSERTVGATSGRATQRCPTTPGPMARPRL